MNDVEAIELNIEVAKKIIAKGDALDRLRQNKDFQLVILDGYFTEEAARVVQLKGAPHQKQEADQLQLAKQIDAIGSFFQYLHAMELQGDMARNALADSEEVLSEMAEAGEL